MAENNNNRMVMILAGTVVVLLVAFVAVVMLTLNGNNAGTGNQTANNNGGSVATTTTDRPGMSSSTASTFETATATKVPGDQTPKAFVTAYHQAILDKKWDVAFKMQPAASISGDVSGFQATWESYGLKAFTIFSDVTTGTDATVIVRLDLGANGIWNTTWNFVKVGDNWLVKNRSKIAMGEPTK